MLTVPEQIAAARLAVQVDPEGHRARMERLRQLCGALDEVDGEIFERTLWESRGIKDERA